MVESSFEFQFFFSKSSPFQNPKEKITSQKYFMMKCVYCKIQVMETKCQFYCDLFDRKKYQFNVNIKLQRLLVSPLFYSKDVDQ